MATRNIANVPGTETLNPVDILKASLWQCVLEYNEEKPTKLPKGATSMMRFSTEHLTNNGDFSLVCNLNIWQEVLCKCPDLRLTETAREIFETDDFYNLFKQNSTESLFPVRSFLKHKGRGVGFLDRPTVIRNTIQLILGNEATYGYNAKDADKPKVQLLPFAPSNDETQTKLSDYRALLLHTTLARLLAYSSWPLVEPDAENVGKQNVLQVQILSAGQQPECIVSHNGQRNCIIRCATVVNQLSGKIEPMSTCDYHKLRANDMLLMARHKYGVRIRCDERFMAHIERIGKATVTVDLLEVKHTASVHTKFNGQGSTRGASFILYNSARVETLLRIFEERVRVGQLPALPNIEDIDFTLLCEEEEWQLVYAYLFTFPQIIEDCLENLETSSLRGAHLIIRYLSGLVATFSAYYRHVRILTDPGDKLSPVLFARIYLLKAMRIVLNKGLALLDIQPVSFM